MFGLVRVEEYPISPRQWNLQTATEAFNDAGCINFINVAPGLHRCQRETTRHKCLCNLEEARRTAPLPLPQQSAAASASAAATSQPPSRRRPSPALVGAGAGAAGVGAGAPPEERVLRKALTSEAKRSVSWAHRPCPASGYCSTSAGAGRAATHASGERPPTFQPAAAAPAPAGQLDSPGGGPIGPRRQPQHSPAPRPAAACMAQRCPALLQSATERGF